MLEMSKMVFVAFMQHCIQSIDFMLETSEILYSVAPHPTRRKGFCVSLPSCEFSGSPP